jgi:hypothetical protein
MSATETALEKLPVQPTGEPTLMQFLCPHLSALWRDWPKDMECTVLSQQDQFSLSGVCPHCVKPSVFTMVTTAYQSLEMRGDGSEVMLYAVLRCSGCLKFILGSVSKRTMPWKYCVHYPLGKPDDDTEEGVPPHVAEDFKEALRCRFVNAHNAVVEMCRRALQACCFDKGAPDVSLYDQIEWLAAKGLITGNLKRVAHTIRLGGNLGAHPPENPETEKKITEQDAEAVVEFTHQLFHDVYVMPFRLEKFDFSKAAFKNPTGQ